MRVNAGSSFWACVKFDVWLSESKLSKAIINLNILFQRTPAFTLLENKALMRRRFAIEDWKLKIISFTHSDAPTSLTASAQSMTFGWRLVGYADIIFKSFIISIFTSFLPLSQWRIKFRLGFSSIFNRNLSWTWRLLYLRAKRYGYVILRILNFEFGIWN